MVLEWAEMLAVVWVELTAMQKKVYRAVLERNFSHLQGGRANALSELGSCCCGGCCCSFC